MTRAAATVDPNQIIGDTVSNPGSVTPLPETECHIPIPKPTFFIVGGAKCGSTMLTSVLSEHPDCCHSAPKETNFFTFNFEQGWDWYRGTFAHYRGEAVLGEGSVSYGSTREHLADSFLSGWFPSAADIDVARFPDPADLADEPAHWESACCCE